MKSLDFANLQVFNKLRLKRAATFELEQLTGPAKVIDLTELDALDGLLASTAELNRAADVSTRIVDVTAATLAVTEALHDGKIITLNRAAGVTVTLFAATGSGAVLKLITGTAVTSNNNIIQVADATDVMTGNIIVGQDAADTAVLFEAAATSDTITMNGTTKGGLKGDIIELIDIAANLWSVKGILAATGTEVTPFSAAV